MIHSVKGMAGFTISSHQVWRPGVYESERAARYAFRFPDIVLQSLQSNVSPSGTITLEMLRAASKIKEGIKE